MTLRTPSAPTRSSVERAAPWLAALLCAAFFAQGVLGNRHKSLTWDEPFHIGGGYAIFTAGEFEAFHASPPLMMQLEALPLLGLDLNAPPEDGAWRQAKVPSVQYGTELLYTMGNSPTQIGRRARAVVLAIGALLVFGVFAFARRLFGAGPALAAAVLAATSPNLLAHAKVATVDLGCSAAMFAAVFSFWRSSETGRARDAVLCGLVTGAALVTKYTALLLGPVFVVLALAAPLCRGERPATGPVAKQGAIVAVAAALVVGCVYGFRFDYSLYLEGVRSIYACHMEDYRYYLLGSLSDEPWIGYHLATVLLKTPVATLSLYALAVFAAVRNPRRWSAGLYCAVPALAVFVAASQDEENLGLRRVLPALPFLFALVVVAFAEASSARTRALLVALLGLAVAEAVSIYPHHLSFFNAAAGGPERGPYLLDESNLDWGQDLPALSVWQKSRPRRERVRLSYFGTARPSLYGVRSEPMAPADILEPRPGVYAVSVHDLVWFRKLDGAAGGPRDWLTHYQPDAKAGHSIWIYEFPEP